MDTGCLPTAMGRPVRREGRLTGVTVLSPKLATRAFDPSGVTATASGSSPTVALPTTLPDPTEISLTVSSPLLATSTSFPSGVTASAAGSVPVVIGVCTVDETVSTTATVVPGLATPANVAT